LGWEHTTSFACKENRKHNDTDTWQGHWNTHITQCSSVNTTDGIWYHWPICENTV
jgi:hypothetical protein